MYLFITLYLLQLTLYLLQMHLFILYFSPLWTALNRFRISMTSNFALSLIFYQNDSHHFVQYLLVF